MKQECLEIGIIQAFLDLELSHIQTDMVSGHIAVCDACALMLADADDESAIVFPALEREFNTLVPTQRLWNKISDSIATERESRTFWHKAWAYAAIAFANPSMAAAAGLLIVSGMFAAFWVNFTDAPTAVPIDLSAKATQSPARADIQSLETEFVETPVTKIPGQPTVKIERDAYRPEMRRAASSPMIINASAPAAYLPGEESYVKTISSLNKTAEDQKEGVLRPSERIAFERDMAIVNDTIAKMKTEVKRNPRNESAKQILYSSYQNKIDLLNSVAQKEDLVASLN